MAVTIKVNGVSNSLVHKGSNGIAKSTLPDVCKTPSPGGPVPIPYPIIISLSSDLKKGTKTVKVDGKKMAAIKGSEFSRCTGDEPGTAGGVKSSTNMKEAKWLLYSFDVKLDGKNACRLSDKMTMNHGNTVCLSGEVQIPLVVTPLSDTCPPHDFGGAPDMPDKHDDDDLNDRIKGLQKSDSPGTKFEGDAAKHNEYEIRRAEKALDKKTMSDDESKVQLTCSVCGKVQDSEVDHIGRNKDGSMDAVEVKSAAPKDTNEMQRYERQMTRLGDLYKGTGIGVMYKVPKGDSTAKRSVENMAKRLGIDVKVVEVVRLSH